MRVENMLCVFSGGITSAQQPRMKEAVSILSATCKTPLPVPYSHVLAFGLCTTAD